MAYSCQLLGFDAHYDSIVRCRYDITGAGIVAKAPDDASTLRLDSSLERVFCVAARLFPCRVAGQSPLLLLQHCEHDDMRTTTGEAAGDASHEYPS